MMTKNYVGKGYINYMTPAVPEHKHVSLLIVLADALVSAITIAAVIELCLHYNTVVAIINAVISMLH
jgi:hypothetical protein